MTLLGECGPGKDLRKPYYYHTYLKADMGDAPGVEISVTMPQRGVSRDIGILRNHNRM
jgi:hypothetical protein